MGQLHLDPSVGELRYLASRTIFSDSPFVRMITGSIKVLSFGFFLLVIYLNPHFSKISNNLFTLSCNCIGIPYLLFAF